MFDQIDINLFSLITLSFLFIASLSWLFLRTLREGRNALKEIDKDKKFI